MPTVVIDATGNRQAINNGLQYLRMEEDWYRLACKKEKLILVTPISTSVKQP